MNTSVLIYAPQAQPPLQRTLFGAITLMAWVAYFYLLLPLVTLLLWALGLRGAYMQLWLPTHSFDTSLLVTLPLLALLSAALLTGWAEINRWRFQGHERRAATANAAPHEVARTLGIPPEAAADLRRARIARVATDDNAVPHSIRVTEALV